jgi:hypothetical protein
VYPGFPLEQERTWSWERERKEGGGQWGEEIGEKRKGLILMS